MIRKTCELHGPIWETGGFNAARVSRLGWRAARRRKSRLQQSSCVGRVNSSGSDNPGRIERLRNSSSQRRPLRHSDCSRQRTWRSAAFALQRQRRREIHHGRRARANKCQLLHQRRRSNRRQNRNSPRRSRKTTVTSDNLFI